MFNSFSDFWNWGDGIASSLIIAVVVCAAFFVAAWLITKKIGPAITRRIDEKKHTIAVHLLRGFSRPVGALLRFLGIAVALLMLASRLQSELLPTALLNFLGGLPPLLNTAIRIAVVVAVAWGLIASSDVTSLLLRNARHKLDLHMSKSVSRFLAAVFNVVVVAVAAVIILSELDYDINGLIAGLGLGGLTIALAAKDSAANFFGGLVLITEKPFEIGDYVATPDVEGTVEDINLRSTKVRLSSGSLTVVPNANLSGGPITNWSGVMEKRRSDFTLQLEYGTTHQQMKALTDAIQTMLETDPEVLSDSVLVRFAGFGESSLNVRIIFYTALPGFGDYLRIVERVNYAIMQLADQHGTAFAFPSRTVYLQDGQAAPEPGPKAAAPAEK